MKKRIFSFLLAFAMLGSSVCAVAAELEEPAPYASQYLDGYGIGVDAEGGGKMTVTFTVYGTDVMDCLGAQKIIIEEWDGSNWIKTGTLTASKNPEFLAYDASEHAESITFYGLPGIQYRATLYAYAERNGVFDMGTCTSSPTTCQ